MLADEQGPFVGTVLLSHVFKTLHSLTLWRHVDVLHYFRQAFARRYSVGRRSSSALSAAVSDVKLFVKFLLDYLINLADDLSYFEMKVEHLSSLAHVPTIQIVSLTSRKR